MPGKKRPSKTKANATPVSPFKGEAGYLRSRMVRDPDKPGWLVLYDRAKGCPPGMDKVVWTESTRWVIMWRPIPGTKAKVLYRALADEARADAALTWAAKGVDALRLWDGRKPPDEVGDSVRHKPEPVTVPAIPVSAPKNEDFPACAYNACARDEVSEPPAGAREKTVQPAPVAPSIPRPPPRRMGGRETFSPEALAEEALLRHLPIEEAMRLLTDIAQNATKSMLTNGEMIDVEDYPTRLKALDSYGRLLVLAKDKREKEVVTEVLDSRHLYDNFMMSPELREEIAAMMAEFERDGVVTTKIKGDVMVPP